MNAVNWKNEMKFHQVQTLSKYYFRTALLLKFIGKIRQKTVATDISGWEAERARIDRGETWLVVGNGPSLRAEDLEALKDLPSVASNKINLLFEKTSWRPAIYTVLDSLVMHKLASDHYDQFPVTHVPTTHFHLCRARNKLTWKHIGDEEGVEKYLRRGDRLSPATGFFPGGTVTIPNLQIAMWMGAKTIYLIGCDHFYANESHNEGGKRIPHFGKSNHFDPNYRKEGEIVFAAPVATMNRGYANIRLIAEKCGIRIINISRNSALTAFETGTVEMAAEAIRISQPHDQRSLWQNAEA